MHRLARVCNQMATALNAAQGEGTHEPQLNSQFNSRQSVNGKYASSDATLDSSFGGTFRKVLLNTKTNEYVDNWHVTHSEVHQLPKNAYVTKRRLKGGLQDNVDVIEICNGLIKATVVPTRGMTIQRVELIDEKDLSLGWESPVKSVVHPYYVNLEDNNGLGWLYSFNGWMVRCGVEWSGHPGVDNGRMTSLHGKIAHIPATEVEVSVDGSGGILLRGKVHEVWFKGANFEVWMGLELSPGSKTFKIRDTVTNLSPKTQEFSLLYHANYGKPILGKGAKIFGTFDTVQAFDMEAKKDLKNWDVYQGPGYVAPGGERLYCVTPFPDNNGKAHVLFQNPNAEKGVAFTFKTSQLPYLSVWKNEDTVANGYVTGIEPGTGFPPNRSIERKAGRQQTIRPNQTKVFDLEFTLLSNKREVGYARDSITMIVGDRAPRLLEQILPR